MEKIKWCVEQHQKTNHFYDTYLPYEFHLRMVVQVAEKFKNLLSVGHIIQPTAQNIILACWGHDLIEDTRVSYNDVKEVLGEKAADIIYAVTNEKGKNRKERANDKYYEGIRNTKGAVFVKLCDRIANVQYSKMTNSRMFELYKKENEAFITQLGYYEDFNNHPYLPMFIYLQNLLENH
jgi:(p)ppGpp synthase/HD superfamily hydrolase